MEPIWIAAILSFLAGLFGYIIAFLWLRPIVQYNKLKKLIKREILFYFDSNKDDSAGMANEDLKAKAEKLRQYASSLSESHSLGLPNWYRILLANRKEKPQDASAHLMKLAGTKNLEHAANRAEKVRESLLL